ncbi:outer membrane protein [Geomesophilobacter sediminis]|uniref:Outer membrane protein beta-barrel domain-containing protein n=1 Tax=Geomesophilobacter sediminis TaxID=2798584 RepID=A0A8J7J2H2_9BACT|nr:hypothetical protein [Geomesophilobacter sediminis]MBJ6724948.1 hypothetical protein [Geomesophilobacter sediminis]
MKTVLLLAVLSFLMVQPALAQDEKVTLGQRGDNAIALGVNEGTATIGYWHKLSGSDDLGVDFGIQYRDHETFNNQTYQVMPAIKHYLFPEKSFSPYLYGGLIASYGNNDTRETTQQSGSRTESYTAGALGGLGMEWFPIRNLSIGGHVGVRAQYEYNKTTYSSSNFVVPPPNKDEGFTIGTFNSGIRLNLSF